MSCSCHDLQVSCGLVGSNEKTYNNYRWQFPIWRKGFKEALTEHAEYIRIHVSGEISIMERFSDLFASYETSQWVQSSLVKISYDWICLLESGLFDL